MRRRLDKLNYRDKHRTEMFARVQEVKASGGTTFKREVDIKDPVLKWDCKAFDRLVPGWHTGKWWWSSDTGFIYEFKRERSIVTITDRQLWNK